MDAWKQVCRCIRCIQPLYDVYKNVISCECIRAEQLSVWIYRWDKEKYGHTGDQEDTEPPAQFSICKCDKDNASCHVDKPQVIRDNKKFRKMECSHPVPCEWHGNLNWCLLFPQASRTTEYRSTRIVTEKRWVLCLRYSKKFFTYAIVLRCKYNFLMLSKLCVSYTVSFLFLEECSIHRLKKINVEKVLNLCKKT